MKTTPTHDEISQRAHQLWQNAGQPDGRHDEFWLQAESELRPPTGATTTSGKHALAPDHLKSEAAAESVAENLMSPAPSDEVAIKAALPGKPASPTAPTPSVAAKSKPIASPKQAGNKLR